MRTASDSIAFEFCWRDIFVCCGLEGLCPFYLAQSVFFVLAVAG
jgi:hypothetical protein